jgi:hypothetical protein
MSRIIGKSLLLLIVTGVVITACSGGYTTDDICGEWELDLDKMDEMIKANQPEATEAQLEQIRENMKESAHTMRLVFRKEDANTFVFGMRINDSMMNEENFRLEFQGQGEFRLSVVDDPDDKAVIRMSGKNRMKVESQMEGQVFYLRRAR